MFTILISLFMKKILVAMAMVMALFSSSVAYAANADYKNGPLGVSFKYSQYNNLKPTMDAQPNAWYYKSGVQPAWSVSVPAKPQDGMTNDFDGYGVIRIRFFNTTDIDDKALLSKLAQDTEVKKLKNTKINRKKAVTYNACGESCSAEALIFGKYSFLNIEFRWEDVNNSAFQKILKSIKF